MLKEEDLPNEFGSKEEKVFRKTRVPKRNPLRIHNYRWGINKPWMEPWRKCMKNKNCKAKRQKVSLKFQLQIWLENHGPNQKNTWQNSSCKAKERRISYALPRSMAGWMGMSRTMRLTVYLKSNSPLFSIWKVRGLRWLTRTAPKLMSLMG